VSLGYTQNIIIIIIQWWKQASIDVSNFVSHRRNKTWKTWRWV